MATQTTIEQPIILYSEETIGPIGPPGPTAISNTPGNRATLGADGLTLVQGPVSGNATPLQVVVGNDTRLTDNRTAIAHAPTHKSGGTDAIKLDELAAPTNTASTILDASTTFHGLLRKLDGNANHTLNGVGNWVTPAGGGDMSRSDYDPDGNFIVEHAALADTTPWSGISGKPVRFIPAGVVMPFAGTSGTVPSGFLLCDGNSYPTASYPDLFTAIQYTYGGSGANFNVPDLRGRVPVGAGQGTGGLTNRALGGKIGEENHPLTIAELATHNHTANQADHYHVLQSNGYHSHSATMPDHQHATPPWAHNHADSGHTHAVFDAVSTTAGPGGTVFACNGTAFRATNVGYAALGAYTTPVIATYYSSQWGGQPGFNTAAANVPATTYESQTMGAVGVVNIANTGSGTGHNNIQPGLCLNFIVAT